MGTLKTGLLAAAATVALFAAGSANAEIVIATAGPMTGPYAAFGEQMKKGAEMAVKDINAAGGVLGEKLKLEVGDDACDPKQAVAVANQFVNQGVKFVAGHFCSGSSIPASAVYNEEGIVQISPASTNPKLTEQNFPLVFRTCGRDDQQGIVAGKYIADHFKGKKIAIVHDKQAYSKGLADETKKTLNGLGITEVIYETITPGEKDYSALVTKLKQAGIEVLYYGGYHTEAGLIARQMREQSMTSTLISGDALVTDEYWSITGEAGNGTLMTFGPDPRKSEAASKVVAEFRKDGYEPEGYTMYTYGAIQAYVQAIAAAKSTEGAKVAAALKSGTFDTVLGKFNFDAKGDVTAPGYVMYSWKGGKYGYASEM
ncbi:branched-chain amino acid ABC transporter substrate-binding protein [Insolitispirillum peregrinum]|uniref:Amino acid/amide ABC transporter substrate-binding protein, HAAT family n=1 Tax=Insolitispirillum peregrinum TaxID=80876 RepID=A0A1N7NTC0_9PROT|nr:branched-chain amino acid ABC transporter substrate-binding protein [Insolitispirillum peregrinum]SIT01584.1 amino acid/amide ABC transporter substrate-binding protein, HAAT family [Insolitispirillum peregrinum]